MIRNVAIALIASGFIGGGAHAATLKVEDGQLIGASGVEVDGTLYDVTFQDGSCNSLFDECNPASFAFNDQLGALAAASALLDQVLIDSFAGPFDLVPSRTRGCSTTTFCEVYTPYSATASNVELGIAVNAEALAFPSDFPYSFFNTSPAFDTFNTEATYANWTLAPIPLPAGLPLLLTGLAGFAGLRLRQKRKAQV